MIVPRTPENGRPDFEGHAYYEYFYSHLAEEYDLVVLSSAYKEPYTEEGITYYPWSFDNKVEGFLGLFRAIKTVKPDIVFAEISTLKAVAAFTISKLYRIHTVLRMAGIPSYRYKAMLSSFMADKNIAVSKAVSEHLYGDTDVIYPGTDFPKNYEVIESETDKTVIGYLGRFSPEKGTDRFLELVEEILPSDEYLFKMAGWKEWQRNRIERLDNTYENFELIGRIPSADVYKYLSGLDLLFMPSRSEGMPRAAIESLYVGTPVIAWDIPALKILIKDEDMLVNSVKEAKQIVEEGNYSDDLDWFNYKKYTIEKEMKEIKELLNEL